MDSSITVIASPAVERLAGAVPAVLVALAVALVLPAATPALAPIPAVGKRPVILFWTDKPSLVPHATYLTPGVTLAPVSSGEGMSQVALLRRGVVPLKWCPGQSLEKLSNAEILKTWSDIVKRGYVAVGIDELGGFNHARNARFARLLERFHREWPKVYIAVWSAGIIDPALAQAYRTSVNLVMIEAYGPWGPHQFERFVVRITEARLFGIVHKCIFALGIDDAAPREVLRSWGAFSNDASNLQAQIRWLARYAQDTAGIGFFAAYASAHMLRVADRLAHRYFPAPAVAAAMPAHPTSSP